MTTNDELWADKLLSPTDLAEYLKVPRATVYAWRNKGTGPRTLKIGRHLRFRWSDVQAWLTEQEGGSDA